MSRMCPPGCVSGPRGNAEPARLRKRMLSLLSFRNGSNRTAGSTEEYRGVQKGPETTQCGFRPFLSKAARSVEAIRDARDLRDVQVIHDVLGRGSP